MTSSPRPTHWVRWTIAALLIIALGSGIWRSLATRKAQQAELGASVSSANSIVLDLTPLDVLSPKSQPLAPTLPIAGTIRALHTAQVKARVPGELRDLVVREGDSVAAGQVLARIDPQEYQARLTQAREQALAAKAQVDIAQRAFDNNRALVQQGFISPTALDTSSATLAAAQANYRAARAAEDVAVKALDDTQIRAPIAGQVSQRLAQPGERVMTEARIVEIVDNRALELEVSVSAADASALSVGQSAVLGVEGSAATERARVVRINPAANATNRAVLAYLSVPPTNGLRHGLFVQGVLETASRTAVTLPLSAVRTDKPRPYVQVLQDGKVVHTTVTLGVRGQVDGEPTVEVQGVPVQAQVLAGRLGPVREGSAARLITQSPQASVPASGAR